MTKKAKKQEERSLGLGQHHIGIFLSIAKGALPDRNKGKPLSDMERTEALQYLRDAGIAFITGSLAWGVGSEKSDMDIVVGRKYFSAFRKELKRRASPSALEGGSTHDSVKFTYMGVVINLIPMKHSVEYLCWDFSTRMLKFTRSHPLLQEGLKNRNTRYSAFELTRGVVRSLYSAGVYDMDEVAATTKLLAMYEEEKAK